MADLFNWIGHRIFSWLKRQETVCRRSKKTVGRHGDMEKGLRLSQPQNIPLGDYVSLGPDVFLQAHTPVMIGVGVPTVPVKERPKA